MAIKNNEAREWICKVVYFGPAFAGKQTSPRFFPADAKRSDQADAGDQDVAFGVQGIGETEHATGAY